MNLRPLFMVVILTAGAGGLSSFSMAPSPPASATVTPQPSPPAPAAGAPQPEWTWPEKGKNLKVIPKDADARKLRAIMTGFTRALGVRCSHCHVGKDGQPLSTYDFASDDNPKKDVARGMLKMLGSINDQLKDIQPDVNDRVNMWCNTCHHGIPRPRTLAEELTLTYDSTGVDSAVTRYQALRTRYYGSAAYDFRLPTLNEVGRHALDKNDPRGATALFRLNVDQFPDAAMAHGSLGEAYLASGDTAQAIAECERAVQLDPRADNAARLLQQLKR